MGLHYAYAPHAGTLEVAVDGDLDLTLTRRLLEVVKLVDHRLQRCVIDTTGVQRVFDSGVSLLMLLIHKLQHYEVELTVLGYIPGLTGGYDPAADGLAPRI